MRSVNVAELRDHLSSYLDCARAGEEIIVSDHDRPVAKLVPFARAERFIGDDLSEEDRELVAAGIMRLPEIPWDPDEFDKLPMPSVKGNAGTQALIDERNEGW